MALVTLLGRDSLPLVVVSGADPDMAYIVVLRRMLIQARKAGRVVIRTALIE